MLSAGSIKYPNKPQVFVFGKREIAPLYLDEYCVIDAKNFNEKRYFSTFGDEVFSNEQLVENNFVAKIVTQIEFVSSVEVLEVLHRDFLPAFHHNASVAFFEDQTSGFIQLLRVYKIDRCIDERYFIKGRQGSAIVMRLYDEQGCEALVEATLEDPVVPDGRFDYIRDEIIHKLRAKGALIGVYNNDVTGRQLLQQIGDIRKSIQQQRTLDFSLNEDRSKTDYDSFYSKLTRAFPNINILLEYIRGVKPAQYGEIPALLLSARDGDKAANLRLIDVHMRAVLRNAYACHRRYHVSFEDAFQEGMYGLIHAIPKYSDSEGTSFSAYSAFWVKQVMHRNVIAVGRCVYIPVHVMTMVTKVQDVVESHLCPECSQQPCSTLLRMVADILECDNDHAAIIINLCMPPLPLFCDEDDMDNSQDNKRNPTDTILSDYGACIDEADTELDKLETHQFVLSFFDKLSSREKEVICMRYGIGKDSPMTLAEIGMKMGLTRERIRQIELKAIRRIVNDRSFKQYCKKYGLIPINFDKTIRNKHV